MLPDKRLEEIKQSLLPKHQLGYQHKCSACNLTDEEEASIDGYNDAVTKFHPVIKELLDEIWNTRINVPSSHEEHVWEEKFRTLGVHLSHCNFGEYQNSCKYGEDEDCPALSESWSWFGKNMQKLEEYRNRLRQIDDAEYERRKTLGLGGSFS